MSRTGLILGGAGAAILITGFITYKKYRLTKQPKILAKQPSNPYLLYLSTFDILVEFLQTKDLLTLKQTHRSLQKIIYDKANPLITVHVGKTEKSMIIPTMFKKYSLNIIAYPFSSPSDLLITNISSLDLKEARHITDSTVRLMSNLTSLHIYGNSGIAPIQLSTYTQLKSLIMESYPITDATLMHLTNLTSIENRESFAWLIPRSRITMTSLSKLKKLKHLFLTAYSITSDDGFSELSNLSSLQLVLSLANDKEPMSPSNIGLLKSFKNLLSLELNNIKGVTDEGLNALTNLTQLRLHGTVWKGSLITDLGFKNLTNLKSLDLYLWYYCEPTLNIDKLVSRIPNLTNLEMHIDELLTDAGLRNLRNLRRLHIAHNKFVTNRSIGNLRKLTYLDISSNRKVTDSSISKLTSLEYLSIHERWTPAYLERRTINCSITFNSLMHLTKLTDLNLQFHKKLSSEITHHLTNLTRLTVVGDAYP